MPTPHPSWRDVSILDDACPLPLDLPFTRAQALSSGVSQRQFRLLLDQGLVRELTHGAYAVSQLRDSIETRARALHLVVPKSVVVTDRTAAWLHGVDALPRSAAHEPTPLDLFSTRESRTRRTGVRAGIRQLSECDITVVHGLRATTPLRTALDLGRGLRRANAFAALCGFRRAELSREDLLAQVERFRGERGVVQLRELAPLADPRPESAAEAILLLHCWDAGIDGAVPQLWVGDAGGRRYRIDVAVPGLMLAFEYQGERAHGDSVQREHDQARIRWLEAHGWYVVEVWAADLFAPGADPEAFVSAAAREARRRFGSWRPQGEFL